MDEVIVHPPDSDCIQLAEQGLSEETLQWYRQQADDSLYFFNKVILGYPDLTPSLHKPFCDWLVSSMKMLRRGVLMPRFFFKSTNVKGYVLWRLRNNTDLRFLFVGESDTVGAKNLNDIRWHLQNNHLLRALYPNMIPAEGAKWTESSILLPRQRSFDEPTITTVGIGAKHTGFHYNEIIYDDPIGLEAAQSPAEMNRAIEWFRAAGGLLDSPESLELIVGTRWKAEDADLYGYIMKENPYRLGANGHEGYLWYIRACIENGLPIFPERWPISELDKLRKRQGSYLFAANMMNDPTIAGNSDFPDEWIQGYSMLPERNGVEISATGEHVMFGNMVRVLVYDPSGGGKSASAENAIVVCGMDAQRRIFVLEDWADNCGFATAIEKWHRINDKWHCWINAYEAVGAHKAVGEILKLRRPNPCPQCGRDHKKIQPREIRPSGTDKEDRIRTLAQTAFEERRVFMRTGQEILRRQITKFPHGSLVDRLDALAYAISLLRPPLSTEEIADRQDQYRQRESTPRSNTTYNYGGYS